MMAGPELVYAIDSQIVLELQEIPLRVLIPEGTLCVVQVDPPSVVPMMTAEYELLNPAASQTLVEGQEIPLSWVITAGYEMLILEAEVAAAAGGATGSPITERVPKTRVVPAMIKRRSRCILGAATWMAPSPPD